MKPEFNELQLPAAFGAAAWIQSPVAGGPRTTAPVPFFRRGFEIDEPVASAQLFVTALGLFELEVNGKLVGEDVLAPGWTDYHRTLYYYRYDVAQFLSVGENAIGAMLGDGWYCGFVAWRNRQIYGDRPRLLLRLTIKTICGKMLEVVSDDQWLTRVGPILESDLLMGEAYDARKEVPDWSSPAATLKGWSPAIITREVTHGELIERVAPSVRRQETLPALSRKELPDWKGPIYVFDLGQNFAGRARISIKAGRGRTIRIRHAEMVDERGAIYTDNLRNARAEDSYVCKGAKRECWEPRFTIHGFRYVEVTGLHVGDECDVAGIVLHTDMPQSGSFRCSHPSLNQLQSNIVWSQKSNFIDVPTDCPQRDERLGWTGDAQIFIPTACFNFDVRLFFHKWLRDLRDAQQTSGAIPCVAPCLDIVERFDEDGGPAWSDALIICPWEIYLHYGDTSILRDNYSSMKAYLAFLLKHRSVGLIRSHPDIKGWLGYGDWLALDGSEDSFGLTPLDLIGTAYLASSTGILLKTAEVLGEAADSVHYATLRQEVVTAFQKRFVTEEGLLTSGTQTAAVLALHFELLPAAHIGKVGASLAAKIRKAGNRLTTGFVGTPYLLSVLERMGEVELAYQLLEREELPSWLYQVKHGATSIWERWDAWSPQKGFHNKEMNSYNHYAYGAVGAWLYQTVAGLRIDPSCPGYQRIIFHPRPGGSITWAEATLQTSTGITSILWEKKPDESLSIKLEIPAGRSGHLILPDGYSAPKAVNRLNELGPGTHIVKGVKEER